MTRSGEKLAGDWEARIVASRMPVPWSKLMRHAAMIVTIVVVSVSALCGFD